MPRPELPIVTERLTLRPFVESDLHDLFAYQSLPEVARYLMWPARDLTATAEALRRRMATTTLAREGDVLVLAVVRRDDGALLGDVNLASVSVANRCGEFGFVFNPAHHGRGYAREAAVEMLRLGFDVFGLHRIIGRCDARNAASAKLMAGLGLRREAHFVRNEIVKGEWTDELVYAMLADEWAAARP